MLVTLMMEALPFTETSVLTTAMPRNIPEDDILLHTEFSTIILHQTSAY
jgi:hypothetical protein